LAFLAGAFVFQLKPDRKKVVLGVGIPSRGSCFLGKHDPIIAVLLGVGVQSRGFCFLGETRTRIFTAAGNFV